MRKIFSLLALIAIFYGAYRLNNSPSKTGVSKPTIKIGVTLPLTGDAAEAGTTNQDAINLAMKKWQQRNTKYNYQVFYLDNRNIPSKGLQNAQNLIRSQKAMAIITQNTDIAQYVSQLAEKAQTIHFSCADDNKVATGNFNFNFPSTIDNFTPQFAQEFENATGKSPKSCTANLYDATDFLIMAYEATNSRFGNDLPNNEDVIKTLHKIKNHNGATGIVGIDQDGVVQSPTSITDG